MILSTLWRCCWGMRSAAKRPWKCSMSVWSRSPTHSWLCSDGNACLIARHSPAFLRRSTRPLLRLCVHTFSKTAWRALWKARSKPVDSGTGRGHTIWSSMWMAHGKLPANERCLKPLIVPLHNGDCVRCVLPATPGANEGRSCEPGRLSCKRIPINGWGRSLTGNGDYRGELLRAIQVISAYAQAQSVLLRQVVIRLDGQYGNGAIVADLAGLAYVMRGRDYHLLDLPQVQARLQAPPDVQTTHPETGTQRALFDVPDLVVTATGERSRVIVATHSSSSTPPHGHANDLICSGQSLCRVASCPALGTNGFVRLTHFCLHLETGPSARS